VALSTLPQIDRLVLATVTTVPEWHPEYDTFEPFPVHAWLIRHPDGAILVDTGVGVGNEAINEWYQPQTTSLLDALAGVGVVSSDISAVIMSHLHFDHCGQHGAVAAPVYVQASEFEAAPVARLHRAGVGGHPQRPVEADTRGPANRRGNLPLSHTRTYTRPSIGAARSGGRACCDRSAVCLSGDGTAYRRTIGFELPRRNLEGCRTELPRTPPSARTRYSSSEPRP
jgi:hypothetical protein